jgi:ATP-dependent Clp protease adaptor protein ClpS
MSPRPLTAAPRAGVALPALPAPPSGRCGVPVGAQGSRAQTVPRTRPVPVPETELEPMYRVIIHNDDVTPMDFVILVLERFFFITGPAAVDIMYTAHYTGAAYVQSLPKNEAQSRINKAHFAAGLEGYPLRFTMEPE